MNETKTYADGTQATGAAPLPDRSPVEQTAPRITPGDVEAHIRSERYFTAAEGCLGEWQVRRDTEGEQAEPMVAVERGHHMVTVCVLILRNGHRVVGVNEGPVSDANFDPEIGAKLARQKAVDQVWGLLGYALRDELSRPVLTEADALADLEGRPRPDHPTVAA